MKINLHMYSRKNDNFSTFYNIVHTFARVAQKASDARDLIHKNKETLSRANNMLHSNVLSLQHKIKTKRKLKRYIIKNIIIKGL